MSRILTPGGSASVPRNESGVPGGIQVRCPRCQTPFAAPIINIVDVKRYPQLKAALLSGELNRAACPSCGAVSALSVPLVYHDPDKELLLVLVPSELNLPPDQQQRLIGGLVQAVMSNVPAEERKSYFLRPETLLSRQRLVERILEADGVTREMLEEQNQRLRLLEELLRASGDPTRVQSLVQENRDRLDYAFFATLGAAAQEAELAGDSQGAQQLVALREQLLQDPELAKRLPQPFAPGTTLEAALDKLLALLDDPEALPAMVVLNRPFFDYLFFQGLTGQLDQARTAGDLARAERLGTLRSRLLAEIEQQDRALQMAQQEDLRIIDELLKSPDQKAALGRFLPRFDTFFLNTLGAAIQSARREGDIERSARLDGLRRAILDLMAESMPPELRLVNRLLSLPRPEERQAVLAESAGLLSDDLVALIEELLAELRDQGQAETAERLQAILEEVRQARAQAAAPGR